MKKYLSFSNRKHTAIQYFVLISSIIGAFFVTWTPPMVVLSILCFYIFNIIGVSLMLHRYYAHKSFEFKSVFLRNIFTFISILSARGTPIAWCRVHRIHHAKADTEKDPHRPGSHILLSFRKAFNADLNIFSVKDMITREHKFISEYYFPILVLWCLLLFLISPTLLYFCWILPVFTIQIVQDCWNYFSHVNCGYRNFNTPDNSRNVRYLWPFILGEAWHNNHHYAPRNYSTCVQKTEYDPVAHIIEIIRKDV